jgi:hypothetical protein
MLATRRSGNVEVRKFGGGTFGSGVRIPNGTGETPQDHLAQDSGGFLHVLLPQITADCCPLLYAYSRNGGGWATSSYPLPQLASAARGAFQSDHRGTAVWNQGVSTNARVFAMRIGPKVKLDLPPKSRPPATVRTPDDQVVVTIEGELTPPSGVIPADVCGGRLLATLKRGRSKVASRRIKVSAKCNFEGKMTLGAARLDAADNLRLTLKLRGNPAAKRSKRTYKLEVG